MWNFWLTWLSIGTQSFGGGASTLFLIHQACIQRGWLDEDEFVRAWALVQMAPGINLVKLTMLVGYRQYGWAGLVLACAGMLLPSTIVTVLMTAGFTAIRDQPLIQAAMRGMLPATIGLSIAMLVQMLNPLLRQGRREGPARLGAHFFLLVSAALLMASGSFSPALVLLLSGAAAAALWGLIPVKAPPQAPDGQPPSPEARA